MTTHAPSSVAAPGADAGPPAAKAPHQGPAVFQYPVRESWLAQHAEPTIDPATPVVDAHHHLWDWPNWRYALPDFLADIATGHNVIGTVYVQCGSGYRREGPRPLRPVGETDYAVAAASEASRLGHAHAGICCAVVAHADLMLGSEVDAVLEAHLAAGAGHVKGIRYMTAWCDEPDTTPPYLPQPPSLLDERWQAGYARLARYGLAFDAFVYHFQLADVRALAERFPDTPIAVDHCGGPLAAGSYATRRDSVFADWVRAVRDLAACPNVSIKLGGLGMRVLSLGLNTRATPPSSADVAAAYRPFAEACIDAFGPSRCMFASNFPVDKASYGYNVFWNACKRLADNYGERGRSLLLADTARTFYRLEESVA